MSIPLFQRVLILCTANISRSPAAKVLLEHQLAQRNIQGVQIRTAGLMPIGGGLPDPKMLERLALHLGEEHAQALAKSHRASLFHEAHARWADLICVMTPDQIQQCLARFPYLRGRVWLFGGSPQAPEPIPDAFGLSDTIYDEVFAKLANSAERWALRLCPA
jgi:protein-tyrosine phosphatase